MRLAGLLLPVVGIDEQRLATFGVALKEFQGVVLGTAPREEERALGILAHRADGGGGRIVELRDPGAQAFIAGQRFELAPREVGMALRPRGDVRILCVLEIAIRIVDHGAKERRLNVARRERGRRRLRLRGKCRKREQAHDGSHAILPKEMGRF